MGSALGVSFQQRCSARLPHCTTATTQPYGGRACDTLSTCCTLPQNMAGVQQQNVAGMGVAGLLLGVAVAVMPAVFIFKNVGTRYNKDDFTGTFDAARRLHFPAGPINVIATDAKRINTEIKRVHPTFKRGWWSTQQHLKYDPRIARTEFIRRSERVFQRLDVARLQRENAVTLLLDNCNRYDALDAEKAQVEQTLAAAKQQVATSTARLAEIRTQQEEAEDRHKVLELDLNAKDKTIAKLQTEKDEEHEKMLTEKERADASEAKLEVAEREVAKLEEDNSELVAENLELEQTTNSLKVVTNVLAMSRQQNASDFAIDQFALATKIDQQMKKQEMAFKKEKKELEQARDDIVNKAMATATDGEANKKQIAKIDSLIKEGKHDEIREECQKMQTAIILSSEGSRKRNRTDNGESSSSDNAPMLLQLSTCA